MSLEPADIAVIVGIVALGPWGLVLVVALVRGYNLTLRLRRRPPAGRTVEGMTEQTPDPAVVVPAVVPVVVEPDPPARVDPEKLDEAAERADITERPDEDEPAR